MRWFISFNCEKINPITCNIYFNLSKENVLSLRSFINQVLWLPSFIHVLCIIRYSAEHTTFMVPFNSHNNFIKWELLFLILQTSKLRLHPAGVKQSWDSNHELSNSKSFAPNPLSGRQGVLLEVFGHWSFSRLLVPLFNSSVIKGTSHNLSELQFSYLQMRNYLYYEIIFYDWKHANKKSNKNSKTK